MSLVQNSNVNVELDRGRNSQSVSILHTDAIQERKTPEVLK